jgi:hypothetical protein
VTRERLEGLHQHVAFAWYTPAQWARLRELAADPEALDPSFAAWLANAERVEAEFTRRGVAIERVLVDVDAVVGWCARRKRRLDSAARSEFVAEHLRKRAAARSRDALETSPPD